MVVFFFGRNQFFVVFVYHLFQPAPNLNEIVETANLLTGCSFWEGLLTNISMNYCVFNRKPLEKRAVRKVQLFQVKLDAVGTVVAGRK